MVSIFDFAKYKDAVAVITDSGKTFTYNALDVFAGKIGKYLHSRNLVFCFCKNEIGALAGYCSFLQKGVVPVLLDATKDTESLQTLLDIYQPQWIWLPQNTYHSEWGEIVFQDLDYALVKHNSQPVPMPEELALLLTTSGSTGSPKLVRLTYRNVLSNAECIAEYLNIDANERPVTSLPVYYSYGISVINSHLIKGATILLTDKTVVQKEFWTFAKEQRASSIAGVPYTYEMLKRLRLFRMDLPALKTLTQAGGKLNAELAKEYIEQSIATGRRFFVMYGQTEATARMSYLPFERALEKYGSIGIAIPRGKFTLIDEAGKEIDEPDKDGELVYSGPNVSLGYAEDKKDLAKSDENNEILYTGDIARRDADGFYYITGRKKRFVKLFGNRVNLDAIEQIVKTIVLSSASVGTDDMVTIFTTDKNKEDEIKSLLAKKTGLNIRAFAVQVIDTIPKNDSGKVQYEELNKLVK